jgi:hypothetical protein
MKVARPLRNVHGAPDPRARVRPLPALALALALAALVPPAAAQQGHGAQVAVTGATFPGVLVTDRAFTIDVDLQNKAGQEEQVYVYAVLYNMTGEQGACDMAHANQALSAYAKAVDLPALQSAHVDGAAERWEQKVNGSALDGTGAHEVCVVSTFQHCPPGTLLGCITDAYSLHLPVRVGNQAPRATASSDRDQAVTGQAVTFTAQASDPDGDALTLAWDLGDGAHATGLRVVHVYAQPGVYHVALTATDGFDPVTRNLTLIVDPAPAGGARTPALGLPALAGGLLVAAACRRR